MAMLQVRGPDFSVTKQKAIEDAKKRQMAVNEECVRTGKEPPPYLLTELIGKGSFGRVYKAATPRSNTLVAVKIIDIEESDTLNPKLADTYSEFLREINALKMLGNSGARNINFILDALPVGQSMWMITEYCAGGSVSTLMKPTAPGGLQEKWIIPILREVAEALFWVHREGIIHRDIKCANVLVTEAGGVQLCDFGVAAVIETKFDKRTTFIGTLHWMAPELFDPSAQYGAEVDIWAFGSMIYEIASGLPPNVMMAGIDIPQFGNYLKQHAPRLEGDQYSSKLKDLVAYCLNEDRRKRPTVEQVQRHPYIFNTANEFPSSSLSNLVRAYKLWEAQGGSRKSLFAAGGAGGPGPSSSSDLSSTALANDEWNFSTTAAFDQQVFRNSDAQAVYDVYGSNVDFPADFGEDTSRPTKAKTRRRAPPPQLPPVRAPLEKVFDPNTISNYEDNARAYYGKPIPPSTGSDLPLRDDSLHSTLRESLIDLDASLHGAMETQFGDMETIKASTRASNNYDNFDEMPDFAKPPLSDPAELNNNRKTQDWKFPTMPPPASANPEMSRFPFNEERPTHAPQSGSGGRPPLLHHPTDPVGLQSQAYADLMVPRAPADNRISMGSLIDLDESLPDPIGPNMGMGMGMGMGFGMGMPDLTRPSTANSETASVSGSDVGGNIDNPFGLERHPSLYLPASNREPSIYVSDDSDFAQTLSGGGLNKGDVDDMTDNNGMIPGLSINDQLPGGGAVPRRGDSLSSNRGGASLQHINSYVDDGQNLYGPSDYSDSEYLTINGTMRDGSSVGGGIISGSVQARPRLDTGSSSGSGSIGSIMGTFVDAPLAARRGAAGQQLRQQLREQQAHLQQTTPLPQLSQQQRQAILQQQQNLQQQQMQQQQFRQRQNQQRSLDHALPLLPSIPVPPAEHVMLGVAGPDDVKAEFHRLLQSFTDHLGETNAYVSGLPIRKAGGMSAAGVGGRGGGGGGINGAGRDDRGSGGSLGSVIGVTNGNGDSIPVVTNGAGSLKGDDEKGIDVGAD